MSPIDPFTLVAVVLGAGAGGWIALHHRLRQARHDRVMAEAQAFGGRLDQAE